jgi:AraC family transcriptional regulator of adaptative response / DNA-3-methyladenine glycosylase II
MALDFEVCWRAWSTRDRRFVGRFVMGVTSTGIYCRPGCPARLPLRRNVRFYASPAAAEAAGFRACRRCRPDAVPGAAAWRGTSATVTRALRLIDEGALAHGALEPLAARLGVTSRWLRALFAQHVGASPLEVAATRRAHFAKRLLEQTALPVEDVALAAGFGGGRRLRAAMTATFGRGPAALRARPADGPDASARDGALALRLAARAPFDPAPLLGFLAARAIPGVEHADGATYRRVVAPTDGGAPFTLEARATADGLTLRVPPAALTALPHVVARVTRLFDLDADAAAIAAHLARDPVLARALAGRAVRVPGAFDRFEACVRALLGQQVSVAAARTLAGRLVRTAGTPLAAPDGALTHAFPSPAAVAAAPLERLGVTRARAAALRGFAAAVADGTLDLAGFADLDDAVARLTALAGIGDWTAHYIAMRALGEPDAFPAGDLGVRTALSRGGALPPERAVRARAEAWRPWRAYAVMALWTAPDEARRDAARRGPPVPRGARRSSDRLATPAAVASRPRRTITTRRHPAPSRQESP